MKNLKIRTNLVIFAELITVAFTAASCVMAKKIEDRSLNEPVASAPIEASTATAAVAKQESKDVQALLAELGGKIHFDFDSAEINAKSEDGIKRIAEVLSQNPSEKLRLDGFTDAVGTSEYNKKLSERRTLAVIHCLTQYGAKADQILSYPHGESMPVATNKTTEGRAENRRVEISLETPPTG